MSTVDELTAEYRAAKHALDQAQKKCSDAAKRLHDAKLEATGLNGCIVEGLQWGKPVKFVVRRIYKYDDGKVEGYLLRKDGTEGERWANSAIADVKNLGKYEG